MSKTKEEIVELFLSNYSPKDIANMLLERMSSEEIDKELEAFEAIGNDPENSEIPVQ